MAANENQCGHAPEVSPWFFSIFFQEIRGEGKGNQKTKQTKQTDQKECRRNDPESGHLT